MTYDEFLNFLKSFEQIKTFSGRITAADQALGKIGAGTGRVVYDIDGQKVLKVARNPKGIAQNEAEADSGTYDDTHHIVTKVFDFADDYTWVIAEKGKKVSEKRIIELTGIPSLSQLYYYMRNNNSKINRSGLGYHQEPEVVEAMNKNEFVQDLREFLENYNQSAGDLNRASSFGEVLRDGQPSIVLTDYGLTDEVYSTYYDPQRKKKYSMYELFNAGDGNDDILSDIGSGDEVRHGMWGLMPYTVGDDAINEDVPSVEPMSADGKEYGIFLANMLSDKLGMSKPEYLDSGGNGHAFMANNNTVLKITSNISEADAAFKTLRHGPPQYLAEVHRIFKIIDNENNKAFFAIYQEFIPDKPIKKFSRYIEIMDTIQPNGLDFIGFVKKMRKEGSCSNVIEDIQNILTAHPEMNISEIERKEAYNFLTGIIKIQDELLRFGIKSNDYTEVGNLGYKDGVLKFFDVGDIFGKVEPKVPEEDIIYLPENADKLDEGHDKDFNEEIAKQVAEMYGYGQPREMGSGTFGIAYDIGGDKVLKITTDRTEANQNLRLIGKPLKYIAQPYKVFSIKSKSRPDLKETYGIVLEKLQANSELFERIKKRLNFVFENIFEVSYPDVIEHMIGKWPNPDIDERQLDQYFSKNPEDAKFFYGIINIAKEVEQYGLESTDYFNPLNLGYKKSGELGFFDVGFGNYLEEPYDMEKVSVAEDGTAKFSTDTAIGQDEFPTYNQNDTSPMTDNNIPRNVNEAGKKSYMPGSQTVTVKKKCRLAGLGNTSAACNQGDINNLELKNIDEAYLPHNKTFWAWVSPDNRFIEVPKLKHQDYIMNVYKDSGGWDYDGVFDQAINDGWVRVIYEYNPDRFMGSLSINGRDKERVKSVFKEMFYDLVKYGNNIIYLDYDKPEGSGDIISTGNSEGKAKLVNYVNENVLLNEEINASDAHDNLGSLRTVLRGKRDVGFLEIEKDASEKLMKHGIGIIPIRMESRLVMKAIIYRNKEKAMRLYQIAKSHGGYLEDKSPEEAREIGTLLGYKAKDIEDYVQKKYGKKVPVLPEPSPDDYDDLAEQQEVSTIPDIDKKTIRQEDDVKIVAVNGDAVRDNGFIEWVDGGHYYVDAKDPENEQKYAKFIPEDEIWIDDVFMQKPNDLEAIILHEKLERYLMKNYGYSYDRAHVIANNAETIFRQKVKEGRGENVGQAIFTIFVSKFNKKFANENMISEAQIMQLQDLPFKQEVEQRGGKIYSINENIYEAKILMK